MPRAPRPRLVTGVGWWGGFVLFCGASPPWVSSCWGPSLPPRWCLVLGRSVPRCPLFYRRPALCRPRSPVGPLPSPFHPAVTPSARSGPLQGPGAWSTPGSPPASPPLGPSSSCLGWGVLRLRGPSGFAGRCSRAPAAAALVVPLPPATLLRPPHLSSFGVCCGLLDVGEGAGAPDGCGTGFGFGFGCFWASVIAVLGFVSVVWWTCLPWCLLRLLPLVPFLGPAALAFGRFGLLPCCFLRLFGVLCCVRRGACRY